MYCYFGSGMLTNAYDENVALQNAKKCEQIADEFAIEFARWCDENVFEGQSYKEALFQFKKEKGL